jgi:serine/threonine protein kinase
VSDEDPKVRSSRDAGTSTHAAKLGIEVGGLVAGRYEILALLGRGGMGSVYRVRDRDLDEVVALKILYADVSGSPDIVERFRREVKLARRVTHTNVARTYDIGEHRGAPILTMELVEGESLAQLLGKSGALSVRRALSIASQMCAGMIAAHDAGVIHRDLKPENVCIGNDGRVVLMDFGIARTYLPNEARLTGGMLGTPAYMAPEQVSGAETIDARADIYALGVVLYEMVTGVVAWTGASPFTVATARLTAPAPDPRAIREDLSAPIAELILRCMALNPADRFADARAVRHAITELMQAVGALPSSRPPAAYEPSIEVRESGPVMGRTTPTAAVRARADGRFERRSGIEGFREDIAHQLVLMGDRSPPYRRILELLDALLADPSETHLEQSFASSWQKRSFEGPYERPLLLLASLRFDALAEGQSHPLFDAVAAPEPRADAVTTSALIEALAAPRLGFWITLRSRRIQTNEVSRSLTWGWPAGLAGCADRGRPLVIVDVGASAGLNLTADLLRLSWSRRALGVITLPTRLDLRARVGFDPRPLDVRNREDRMWLHACVWPGQVQRTARLEASMTAFERASPPPELSLLRASSVPEQLGRFAKLVGPRGLVLVYQTFVGGYIPVPEREAYERDMDEWLCGGPKGQRAWATLELEDGTDPEFGCAIDVHVSSGAGKVYVRLGRTGYHPSVVDADSDAERRLAEAFTK